MCNFTAFDCCMLIEIVRRECFLQLPFLFEASKYYKSVKQCWYFHILEPVSYHSGGKKTRLLFQYPISTFNLQQLDRQKSRTNKSCGGADEGKAD